MSIFNAERGLRKSEIKEKLKYWYDVNMKTANEIPESARAEWEERLKQFIHMQYQALLCIFEIRDDNVK